MTQAHQTPESGNLPEVVLPRPPAHIEPYVDVLGHEVAICFLLSFVESALYFAKSAGGRSEAEALLGKTKLDALSDRLGAKLTVRIPMGNPWIIATLHARGLPANEIARTVRVSIPTVYKWLKHARQRAEEGKAV